MNRIVTVKSAVVIAILAGAGFANADGYIPGDGRNLSQEQLNAFEQRAAVPMSAAALAREKWFNDQATRAHGSVDD